MTLLSDLLDLPEHVSASDFVINLDTGLARPEDTLGQYVVTPQLADCFGDALGLVASSLADARSKAAFLHGSFGSGKTHFMTVLSLLLQGHPRARAIPELHEVVAAHDPVLQGRTVLLVPFHAIGARSVEQVILGGYAEHMATLHPDRPAPAVYVADGLIANAVSLRGRMGDEAFFAALNDAPDDDGWGSTWDADSFERAAAASADDRGRKDLVSSLVGTLLSGVPGAAHATGDGLLPLDEGLEVLSQHAHALGYHAVVLFLDELLLWLGSQPGDVVKAEATKIAKLVEGDASKRPAPIASFIARQRELTELVGSSLMGAERASLSEALKWWEGRFDTITLEDQNLTVIAEKRLLQPRSEAARVQIDAEFDKVTAQVAQYRDVLLTTDGNVDAFRKLYPFNPALVKTLVALSNALQRERTALKVMLQLLVDNRNRLELGQLIPLGALWDVLTSGNQPLTPLLRAQLDQATTLWSNRLEPELRTLAGLSATDDVSALPVTHRYVSDGLMVKSLLLAALVPDTPVLRDLNVTRLVALNHGTIRTPFAGTERSAALKRLQELAAVVGEVRVADDPHDPAVRIQLTGVDTGRLMDQVRTVDNFGARWSMAKRLIIEALEVHKQDSMAPYVEFEWRGTRRRVDVLVGNVRDRAELTVEQLRAGSDPKLVIDLPLDQGDYNPKADKARLETDADAIGATLTACWLPVFLTEASKKALGDLVVTEYLLTGDAFDRAATDLSPADRSVARELLANQREQLRNRVKRALGQAFGVSAREEGYVDASLDLTEQVHPLMPGLQIRLSAGLPGLRAAALHIGSALLARQYPAHPDFPTSVKDADLRRVRDEVLAAVAQPDGRRDNVDKTLRPLMKQLAVPLQLGTMYDAHFVTSSFWQDHFEQAAARAGVAKVTVRQLRQWMDHPEARGLPPTAGDVVISVFAAQTNRAVMRAGRSVGMPDIGRWDDADELVPTELPTDAQWQQAKEVAAGFGLVPLGPLKSASVVSALGSSVVELLRQFGDDAVRYLPVLRAAAIRVMPGFVGGCPRDTTAAAVADLVQRVLAAPDRAVFALAETAPPTSAHAMGTSLKQSAATITALGAVNWPLLEAAFAVGDAGKVLEQTAGAVFSDDEVTRPLASGLRDVEATATRILLEVKPPPPPPPPPPVVVPPVVVPPGTRTAGQVRAAAEEQLAKLRSQVEAEAGITFTVTWHDNT